MLRDTSVVGYKVVPYEMELEPVIDIDTEDDFQRAKEYLGRMSGQSERITEQ